MAGVNQDQKGGKKDDTGLGSAIDFVLSNAKLVLGVGGAAMLGIATLAVKKVRCTSERERVDTPLVQVASNMTCIYLY